MKNLDLGMFIGRYPIQKTLRFELKPIGKTQEWIEQNGLIEQDEQRADDYMVMKKIIDHYHKNFIETSMSQFRESIISGSEEGKSFVEQLDVCKNLRGKNDATLKKKYEKAQEYLRKLIVGHFDTKRLFGKELIKEDLMSYLYECHQNGVVLENIPELEICKQYIEEFKDFTTYFTGFHENRKNMYSDEAKSTAIAYRLIHDNLPKHLGNQEVWQKIKEMLPDDIKKLESEMATYLQGRSLDYYFSNMEAYALCLTQSGITIYNGLIGGRSEGDNKIQGLNEYINLYNQRHKEARLPKMTELYKMILTDRESLSWLPQRFGSDAELLEKIEKAYQVLHNVVFEGSEDEISLKELLANIGTYDLKGIYIKNDTTLTGVIKQAYGDWSLLHRGVAEAYRASHPQKKQSDEKYAEACKKYIDSFDSFSLADIANYCGSNKITDYYEGLASDDKGSTLFELAEESYLAARNLLNVTYTNNLRSDGKSIELIKSLLDSLKAIQRFASTLCGNGDESGRDARFYGEHSRLMNTLNGITPLYNMVRNYVTKRATEEEKFKLNFDNSTLLNGWDQNKETDNYGVILRKDGMFYLGIMSRGGNKSFASEDLPSSGKCYEKMDYKLLPGPNKMLPKVFFSQKNIDYYAPSDELLQHYNAGTHKKGDTFNLKHCHELIDFFKSSIDIHPDWSKFGFEFSPTSDYGDISKFYKEVTEQGYKLTFRNVSESYIDKLVEDGKLYLFQIYNKDFSSFSKGTPNMHTMYWKALFSPENLKDVVYKLNGEAEVFFRRKSIEYDSDKMKYGHHYEQLKDKFNYPIIKDRRYTMDKFQFHVPITMNFKASGNDVIDYEVREFIKQGGIEHIIGIDRGERHLLYLSMIDLNGNIVKQFTLNEIINEYRGKTFRTNYHELLDKKEVNRDEARRNWQTIETIKELKEGYLSQVVHVISQLMVQYKAIVVLEDLNLGFMRGRQKVEKQVYQKFEKMLIDKLNYLVDKQKKYDEEGGLLKAYQLTSKFESFQKMGKQSGFLFYVPASLTSKIDPVTGFANYINTKYDSVEKARDLIGKFADIRYNKEKDYFEFEIDNYKGFNPKAAGKQQWVLCSYGTRIRTFRNDAKNNEWDSEEVMLTERFKHLFEAQGVDYRQNLMGQILLQDKAPFFKDLLANIGLMLQLRNSRTGTDEDYILSPVANNKGVFYDSRNYCKDDSPLPKDADANGAYNIARKGLWAVRQMQQAEDPSSTKLAINNEEWMLFAQGGMNE